MKTSKRSRVSEVVEAFTATIVINGYYVLEKAGTKSADSRCKDLVVEDILQTNMVIFPPMAELTDAEQLEAFTQVREWIYENIEVNQVMSRDFEGTRFLVSVCVFQFPMSDLVNFVLLCGDKLRPYKSFTPIEQLVVQNFAFDCYERAGQKNVPIYADCVDHRFRAVYRLGRAMGCSVN